MVSFRNITFAANVAVVTIAHTATETNLLSLLPLLDFLEELGGASIEPESLLPSLLSFPSRQLRLPPPRDGVLIGVSIAIEEEEELEE